MTDIENPLVVQKFHTYPDEIKPKMLFLRQLILETAEMEKIDHVEETLKWGEPRYLYKSGSTIRIDWKESAPNQYAMYFNCRTILVETFKEMKKLSPDTHVIMMTAYAVEDLIEEAIQEGVSTILYKPLNIEEILDSIESQVAKTGKIN